MDEDIYGFDDSQVARIAAAVRAYEGGDSGRFDRSSLRDNNYGRVWFRNDNAGTAPKYGVLRVTGTVTVDQFAFLTVDQPTTTLQRLYLINGSEDVVTNGYGWGTWMWHGGQALYDSGTPAIGEGWGPKASQWSLSKNYWGFTVLGGNDTTLTTTLSVQHVVNHVLGKTNASHAKSASGTINLYTGTLGSETQVTSMTVTAYNRYAAIGSGKWVECDWVNGGWSITSAEC